MEVFMRKFLIYFFAFVFICFILPAIFTKQEMQVSASSNENQEKKEENSSNNATNDRANIETNDEINNYEYKNYGTIKLLHKSTGETQEVKLDTYLCNVVSAEMPATYELEALKAQAIVARTYTIYKIKNKKHNEADICDDSTCCQAWISKEDRLNKWDEGKRQENWQKIVQCVKETAGKIITYNNEPINAFFHSNSGGTTEVPVNVWGGTGYPYLQVVETSGEDSYSQYSSEAEFTNEELLNKLEEKYQDITIDFNNQDDIKILEHTDSGRVKTVKFGNHEISGVEARTILNLRSANFEIIKEERKNKI